MKVDELIERLKTLSAIGHGDDEVAVRLKEPSIGPAAKVGVKAVGAGFDWDAGTTFAYVDEPVSRERLSRDEEAVPFRVSFVRSGNGESHLACPKCERKLHGTDAYCPGCGQKIKTGEFREMEF